MTFWCMLHYELVTNSISSISQNLANTGSFQTRTLLIFWKYIKLFIFSDLANCHSAIVYIWTLAGFYEHQFDRPSCFKNNNLDYKIFTLARSRIEGTVLRIYVSPCLVKNFLGSSSLNCSFGWQNSDCADKKIVNMGELVRNA